MGLPFQKAKKGWLAGWQEPEPEGCSSLVIEAGEPACVRGQETQGEGRDLGPLDGAVTTAGDVTEALDGR